MEPLAALALACNVLALIEGAVHATKACKQIHERGSLVENDRIEDLATSVAEASRDLTRELSIGKSRNVRLNKLAKDAADTGKDLQTVLNSIKFAKTQAGKNRLTKLTLRTLIKRGVVKRLESQLKDHQNVLSLGLLSEIYKSCGQAEARQTIAFAKLDTGQQDLVSKFIEGNLSVSNSIVGEMRASESRLLASHKAGTTKITDLVKVSELGISKITVEQTNRILHEAGERRHQQASDTSYNRLLNSLHFDAINERQNMVSNRISDYGDTFQWIFDPSRSHNFAQWLESGKGLYWISGYAASGKSSLVGFILQDLTSRINGGDGNNGMGSLEDEVPAPYPLQTPFQLLSFFFYKPSANRLLKTFEGFWRSLCYQLLTQQRELFEIIRADSLAPNPLKDLCGDRHRNSSGNNRDLKNSFLYLLKKAMKSTQYFVLVDGPDEFAEDQEQLINCLDEIVQVSNNIQLCCSSRPESLFERKYKETPSLRLQDLTRDDMLDVCERHLSDTKAAPLIDKIIEKAQGVFLWLHLVVEDLRKAAHHDSMEELAQRLDECPSQMKGLFKLMLDCCDSFYVKTKPRPYLMYVYSCLNLGFVEPSLLDLALNYTQLVQLEHDSHKPGEPFKGFVDEAFLYDISSAEQRIVKRTAGLIQVSPLDTDDPVKCADKSAETQYLWGASRRQAGFIHRTAFDFLSVEQEGQDFLHACDSTEADVTLDMLTTRIWKCLLFKESPVEHVSDTASILERLSPCPPAYTRLLDQFYGYLANLCPRSGPSSTDFRNHVQKNHDLTLRCVVPEVTIKENLAFILAGRYGLFEFAAWKLAAYPTGHQRKQFLCLFLTHRIDDFSTHHRRPITSSGSFMDLLVSEADLGQSFAWYGLYKTGRKPTSPGSPSPAAQSSLLGMALTSLLKSHIELTDERVAGAERHVGYGMIPSLLEDDSQLNDIEIEFCIMNTDSPYPYIQMAEAHPAEKWCGSALLKWRAGSLTSWLCDLHEPAGIWPKVISVSPKGTDRWWNTTEDDNLALCRDRLYARDLRSFAEYELFTLEGNLLNRNIASLSQHDFEDLKTGRWLMEFGFFIGRSMLSHGRKRKYHDPIHLLYPRPKGEYRDSKIEGFFGYGE